jgi:hypothetical protein
MSMAICLGPNGRGEEYHAPRGRSGSNRACRNAAVWSLTGRSGHGADIVIRSFLTGSGASRPPFTALRKVYSITSSAMESTPAGMVKPSIFVVLRFSASSNFVGCRTGKSAGFRPLEFGRQTTNLTCEQAPLAGQKLLPSTTEESPQPVDDAVRLVIAQSGIKR